jgi:chromosome segregation ATPase
MFRVISLKDNTSKWFLNRQVATMKAVDELMASLSIDMSNICTFMPQDRVSAHCLLLL